MIRSRDLDDQTYESIVEAAVNRIPYIYPEWTDYNPHDPGITLIELFAWYKEMQQYHMNVVTPELRRKLLKLAGARPKPARSASYIIELPAGSGSFPELSRMETLSGVVFELEEPAHAPMNTIERVFLETANVVRDLSEIAVMGRAALPELFGGNGSALHIGMSMETVREELRLWFDISEDAPPRNPFESEAQLPRRMVFEFSGAGRVEPVRDETHGLTVSGFVTFKAPAGWTAGAMGKDLPELHYISIRSEDAGCDVATSISRIEANVFRARQRETLARTVWHTVEPAERACAELRDALSRWGTVLTFVRTERGLRQESGAAAMVDGETLSVTLNAADAARDGEPNLLTVSLDPVRYPLLLRDSTGLPRQRVEIEARDGLCIDGDSVTLLCDAICEDGQVRPMLWQRTDDLLTAGPRDRVFELRSDEEGTYILFGDGEHGDIVPKGCAAILMADVCVTLASGGNVPDGHDMPMLDADVRVSYRRERPGRERQSEDDAAAELLRRLDRPGKCVTAEDHEAIAMETPGVRIMAAKALTMFDPDSPVVGSTVPVVTLVVIPAGHGERPKPDRRFLEAVRRHVDRRRTICTRLKVAAPLYVGVHVSVRLLTQVPDIEDRVRAALKPFFDAANAGSLIGRTILHSEAALAVGNLPETLKLARLTLTPDTATAYTDKNGDLCLPRHGMPYLASLTVERL